jgi:hypothetical protein
VAGRIRSIKKYNDLVGTVMFVTHIMVVEDEGGNTSRGMGSRYGKHSGSWCGWWGCAAIGNREQNVTFLHVLVAVMAGRGVICYSCSKKF